MAYINGKKVLTINNTVYVGDNFTLDAKPKGVYASLSALQTAYPTGSDGVYLTSDNGHWYYYDSGWQDGGVYQASVLGNRAVKTINVNEGAISLSQLDQYTLTNIFKDTQYINLTKNDLLSGNYYNTNAELVANDSSLYSNLIDISAFIGNKLKIVVNSLTTTSIRSFGIKSETNVLWQVQEKDVNYVLNSNGLYEYELLLDADTFYNAKYLFFSCENKDYVSISVVDIVNDISKNSTLEFSSNGLNIQTQYFKNTSNINYTVKSNSNLVVTFEYAIDDPNTKYNTGWNSTPYVIKNTNCILYRFRFKRLDGTNPTNEDLNSINIVANETTANEILYVSPSGSDANLGTYAAPLRNINTAITRGAKIVNVFGGTYYEQLDLTNSSNVLEINNISETEKVVIKPSNYILANSAELVEGYSKVYKCDLPNGGNIADNNKWIFQEGVNDASTLIADNERHPSQRGYEYRCEDTKIERIYNAESLSSALSTIENSSKYLWYYDSNNSIIYFSSPENITSAKPLTYSRGYTLFTGNTPSGIRNKQITIRGVETKYLLFNVENLYSAEIVDCKSTNVYGFGAFSYSKTLNAKFVSCEAARCFTNPTLGDGFNAHSNNSGDIYSKQTTCTLLNCWSHDNNDDGYSDHERCETLIIGGLYEYNGKAGITPSYGDHCECHNVYSRNNYNGFNYTGVIDSAEGGKYGQLICYNCVAENNKNGGSKIGFKVEGAGNSAIFINCKSINNETAFSAALGTTATLIECSSNNDTNIKIGDGTFIIKNGTLVE